MYNALPAVSVSYDRATHIVTFVWQDETRGEVSDTELRSFCACADCRVKTLVGQVVIGRDCTIESIEALGTAGLTVRYCDGHDKGIYPWEYLQAICAGDAKEYLRG